ncbi:VCBS repeat-containing protein [Streptomyces sp. NRRL B-24572]|uniref:FG-GAP repeat domain-containing protein n=1 Tax=Streptomyces sp. NRRL B-24572 TaxID=1962156 RepID=UPI000A3B9B31|nr:VCBS repeat-containing protein [Streptomyces sp. NRRL B-24572]
MSPARTSRHRLAAAVTVALAVTVGTLTAGAAATAAPAAFATTGAVTAAAGESAEQDVVPFPVDSWVMGAGPTGFLSTQSIINTPLTWRWTRFADGVTTVLPGVSYASAHGSDIVSSGSKDGVFTLYDMGSGGDPLEIDINPLGGGYTFARYAGTRLVMKKANATGGTDVHIIGKPQGVLVDETVTGLPADAVITYIDVDSPDTAVIRYSGTVDGVKRNRAAVVDIATHAVVEEYELPEGEVGSTALSATHIAWVEKSADSTTKVAVTRRGTNETVRHDLGTTAFVAIELIGDWVTYRQFGTYGSLNPNALYALYARSLTTGETVKLLEHTTSSVSGAGGVQMARGGTIDQGEGLYRIAPGADGAPPVVTLVASTGEPTKLGLVKQDVPATIDFDRTPAPVPLSWTLSRTGATVNVELVHTATGKRATVQAYLSGGTYTAKWDGLLGDSVTAYNGDYTWKLTATPHDKIGPDLVASGSFKVVHKPTSHDFDDNGSSDLLVRNGNGELFVHDGYTNRWGPTWQDENPVRIGTGWNTYDQLVAPGNIAGSSYADIVARDKTGVLWLHQGAGRTLAPRVRVGGGWQIYDQLTGGSDLNGDGRPDLLARDKTGVLWLYKGTGSVTSPFATRVKVGGGWGVYNTITATENIGGAAAGDLVARDAAGVLWLYLGRGDGTFASRTRIGDWRNFVPIRVGDVDHDGRPDLVGDPDGAGVYFAKGTGNWRAPFEDFELKTYIWPTSYPTTMF